MKTVTQEYHDNVCDLLRERIKELEEENAMQKSILSWMEKTFESQRDYINRLKMELIQLQWWYPEE